MVNITHLLVNCQSPRNCIDLYNALNKYNVFPDLNNNRRYTNIVWDTCQKLPLETKVVIVGEQHNT